MDILFLSRKHSKKSIAVVVMMFFATIFTLFTFGNSIVYANMVSNPGFESGTTGWNFYVRGGAANGTTTTSTKNSGANSYQATVTTATGGDPHGIELAQAGKSITAGQTYTLQFWARASTNRAMDVVVMDANAPYALDMRKNVQLTTAWQFYSYTFVPTQSRSNAYIGFQFGDAVGTYYVDDVLMVSGTITPTAAATPTTAPSQLFTVGTTSIGGSYDSNNNVYIHCNGYTAPDTGQLVSMSAYVNNLDTEKTYALAIYSDNNNNPGTLIAKTANGQLTEGLNTLPITGSIASGNRYWLCYHHKSSVQTKNQLRYTTGPSRYVWRSATFGTWPSVYGSPAGSNTVNASLYATVSKSAGVLVKTVNFNGPELNVDGVVFSAEAEAGVTFPNGVSRISNSSITLNPGVSTNKATMLRSSVWRGASTQLNVDVALPNNNYFVYLYSWEDTGAATFNIGLEGQTVDSQIDSGAVGSWKKLGPYNVTVSDGKLSLFQTGGDYNLSGLEVYTAGPNNNPTPTPLPPSSYKSITYRASNTANNGAGSTSLTLTKPAGTIAGDVLVAQVVVGGAGTTAIGAPTGWSIIRRDNSSTSIGSALYYKVATSSEPASYQWTLSPSVPASGGIAAYYNVDTGSPIDAHAGLYNSDTATMTAPSVTTSTPADRLLFFGGVQVGTTVAPPSGMTTRFTSSGGRTAYLSDRLLSVSGDTGNQVGQHNAGAQSNISSLVALRPAVQSAAGPVAGSVVNLNFFVTNAHPWMQNVCGDFRMDNGLDNPVPAGQSMMTTTASCSNPGIVYSGDLPATFGEGQASSTNQVVGGHSYPEVYSPSSNGGIFSSYDYLEAKSQSVDTPPINLATICPILSDCTLPANLPRGIYKASGNVTFNQYTFPVNQHYVFLIDGNMTIRGNLITPVGSSTVFSVSGNIVVLPTVGVAPTATTPNLSGVFSTDKSFIVQSTNTCADLRLNFAGVLIANAAQSGGSLQNERDLCGNNLANPSMQIVQRLDLVLNLPEFVRIQSIISNELSP